VPEAERTSPINNLVVLVHTAAESERILAAVAGARQGHLAHPCSPQSPAGPWPGVQDTGPVLGLHPANAATFGL
jgi:hypothetical protein